MTRSVSSPAAAAAAVASHRFLMSLLLPFLLLLVTAPVSVSGQTNATGATKQLDVPHTSLFLVCQSDLETSEVKANALAGVDVQEEMGKFYKAMFPLSQGTDLKVNVTRGDCITSDLETLTIVSDGTILFPEDTTMTTGRMLLQIEKKELKEFWEPFCDSVLTWDAAIQEPNTPTEDSFYVKTASTFCDVDLGDTAKNLSSGALIGIAVGGLILGCCLLFFLYRCMCGSKNN